MTRKLFRLFCISALVCGFASCQWHEAKAVIALADSLDRTEHIIHDDTVALRGVIRILDNPLERWIYKNTLGKAYYYMGRNLSLSNCIAEAAKCYVEADRLQIDDPIIRGRVNSNMGNISDHNNNDSLALIFYERASEDFKESGNMWRYAHSILDICEFNVALGNYNQSDSLLKIAETYLLDSSYQARLNETRGICFYNKLQYDSAMVYFNRALSYWQGEEDKCFSYLKMMQSYYFGKNDINSAIYYAKILISTSNNPNYLSNAYYCLMQDAKTQNNVEQLSQYSHARTDAQKLLRNFMVKDAEALPILMEYVKNPYPLRWIRILFFSVVALCIVLVLCIWLYRKHTLRHMQVTDEQIVSLSAQVQEHQSKLQKQSKQHYYDKCLEKIRRKYPKPLIRWNEYAELKKDLQPYLHNWFVALEELDLTNREKVFCTVFFVYPQMPTDDLSNHLCITKEALSVRKNRIVKKLGITSNELGVFMQQLANKE